MTSGHPKQLAGIDDGALRWCFENTAVVLTPSLVEGYGFSGREAIDLRARMVTSTDAALMEVSGDAAQHVAPHDVAGWARAIAFHLVPRGSPPRGSQGSPMWAQVADETVRAVLG